MTDNTEQQYTSAQQQEEEEKKLKEEERRRRQEEEMKLKNNSLPSDTFDFENSFFNGDGLKIICHSNPDGSYTAITTKGQRLRGKNFEEISDQSCKLLKESALAEGKEPKIAYNNNPPNEHKSMIFCRNAILKFDVTISPQSDIPQDKNFWKELHSTYMNNGGTQENWEKMTRFVPDDIIGRSPEEIIKNKNLIAKFEAEKNNNIARDNKKALNVSIQNSSVDVQSLVTAQKRRLHT